MHAFEPKKLAIASGLTASLLGAFMLGGVALGQVSANASGTAATAGTRQTQERAGVPGTSQQPETPIDPAQAKITQAAAEVTALDAYPGGSVVKSQLDSENGTLVWDIDVKDNKGATHDVKVDATSGQVVTEPQDGHDGAGSDD